jgi:hypothetical protein
VCSRIADYPSNHNSARLCSLIGWPLNQKTIVAAITPYYYKYGNTLLDKDEDDTSITAGDIIEENQGNNDIPFELPFP